MSEETEKRHSMTVGRYLLHRQIARGGMATIHIARLMGDEGFSRIVAAKRLLPEFAEDTEFVAMFMDEARIASKVHHPNVVPVLDLVTTTDEVMLVQEYVHGVPLHVLLRTAHEAGKKIPVRIAVSIAAQTLAGLHAAHTTVDEMGAPLDIVHRDVSPQNVMVAVDGSARLLDFGVAKATMAAHVTRDGTFKGKLAYSAPEQVRGKPVQQSDVYALAVVLWELLVGHRMHGTAQGEAELVATILGGKIPPITEALANEADWGAIDSDEWKALSVIEPIVQKGLAVEVADRFQTAAAMEEALAKAVPPASSSEVATWVKSLGKDFIETRDKVIAAEEASWRKTAPATSVRRTPVPGSTRMPTIADTASSSSPSSPSAAMLPAHPPSLKTRALIGVLGVLVILLSVGVVFAMHGSTTSTVRRAKADPVPVAAPVQEEPPPPPVVAPEPVQPVQQEQPTEVAAEPPAPAPTVRHPVRAWTRATRVKQKEKAPEPAPVPAAVEQPKPQQDVDDCKTPYYFEGNKKIFKPNCL
jgi:serine/threonine-protein kinase